MRQLGKRSIIKSKRGLGKLRKNLKCTVKLCNEEQMVVLGLRVALNSPHFCCLLFLLVASL